MSLRSAPKICHLNKCISIKLFVIFVRRAILLDERRQQRELHRPLYTAEQTMFILNSVFITFLDGYSWRIILGKFWETYRNCKRPRPSKYHFFLQIALNNFPNSKAEVQIANNKTQKNKDICSIITNICTFCKILLTLMV